MKPRGKPKLPSRRLEGCYLSDGVGLWLCVAHTTSGLRLENCYTNLQDFFTFDQVPEGLRYVCDRRTDAPKAA